MVRSVLLWFPGMGISHQFPYATTATGQVSWLQVCQSLKAISSKPRIPLILTSIFMWGFFLMLQAACNSFTTLGVLRALAGAAEACSDPSFMLITQMWYTRREQPLRIGLWYTANGLGIALGGLLGYAIGHIVSLLSERLSRC